MIAQHFCHRVRCQPNQLTRCRSSRARIQRARSYATSSPSGAVASPQPQSSASALGSLTTELDKIAPRFEIPASQIKILAEPSEFYETLKTKIINAQRRIYLSTLYIGKTETELISTIQQALRRNPALHVSILTDALRGTRETPNPSCASLLAPLITGFGEERVEIRMFHTPNLTGLRKSLIPRRINEGWGLQHMKLYGIDDEIMLSGANLSDDYFTNRQDRYHIFESTALAEYFARIHHAVCKLSFAVMPDQSTEAGYSLMWPSGNPSPSPLEDVKGFRKQASATLSSLIKLNTRSLPSGYTTRIPSIEKATASTSDAASINPSTNTIIYPIFQFTPFLSPDISTELPSLRALLKSLSTPTFSGSKWTFTAGYFNMTAEFRRLLLKTIPNCESGTVIAASPWANGFYKSPGVSGMLPDAYTLLSRRFLQGVRKRGLGDYIGLKEWRRGTINQPGGWTYHAKGIWVTLPSAQSPSPPPTSTPASSTNPPPSSQTSPPPGPSITIIGSSNYTKRSYSLDLEANVMIVTRDADLQRRLGEEEKRLQEYATTMTEEAYAVPERRVGLKVRVAMFLVTLLGGAL